jgi:hypothetical protein
MATDVGVGMYDMEQEITAVGRVTESAQRKIMMNINHYPRLPRKP